MNFIKILLLCMSIGLNSSITHVEKQENIIINNNQNLVDAFLISFKDGTNLYCSKDTQFLMLDSEDKKELKEPIKEEDTYNPKICTASQLHNIVQEKFQCFIMASIFYPINIREQDYELKIGNYVFNFERAILLSRILGYTTFAKNGEISFITAIDLCHFMHDLEILTKKYFDINISLFKIESEQSIFFEQNNLMYRNNIIDVSNYTHYKMINKNSIKLFSTILEFLNIPKTNYYPNFIIDNNCPLVLVKNFLGGYYGKYNILSIYGSDTILNKLNERIGIVPHISDNIPNILNTCSILYNMNELYRLHRKNYGIPRKGELIIDQNKVGLPCYSRVIISITDIGYTQLVPHNEQNFICVDGILLK